MRGGHVSVHHQRLAAEVLIHGLGHLPRARHARRTARARSRARGRSAPARAKATCVAASSSLEAKRRIRTRGRRRCRRGKPRVTRRAGDAGGSRAAGLGSRVATVTRPDALERFSAGSSAGRARREVCAGPRAEPPSARATSAPQKSQFEMSVAKKNGFGSSGTVTGTRSRAFFKAFVPIAKHPPLATPPDAPRCRARPFKLRKPSRRPVDPPRDRATRRASSDRVKYRSREKTLASVQTTPPPPPALDPRPFDATPPSGHHYAITKRSARFAERTV